MTGDRPPPAAARARAARRIAAGGCLVAPVAALLWVPAYTRREPELAGIPFFYWYQLAWVPGCAAAMFVAYLLLRRPDRRHP
ncbi:DUF3311 domain-containing protein [Embleya scabrispora]|uniref:DUF3311 domain-containing protein n=1 Tax=Embleya scabrispora TaxID=159449 RepID=UPI000372B591|nr:DUF3311 domain-containing protein [Embleya scabrispora]MYS81489.1 DUF3311 domain-containing protein [Streptomyces sp. SID5474]